MLPILTSAVVPVYNIQGVTRNDSRLVLDRETLAAIFMGEVTKWDDERILKDNKDMQAKLSGKQIRVVYRSDKSGTTEILTRALSSFSSEWKQRYGTTNKLDLELKGARNDWIKCASSIECVDAVLGTDNSLSYTRAHTCAHASAHTRAMLQAHALAYTHAHVHARMHVYAVTCRSRLLRISLYALRASSTGRAPSYTIVD